MVVGLWRQEAEKRAIMDVSQIQMHSIRISQVIGKPGHILGDLDSLKIGGELTSWVKKVLSSKQTKKLWKSWLIEK